MPSIGAFGAYLIDQPLMRNVLADLARWRPRPPPSWQCGWPRYRQRSARERDRSAAASIGLAAARSTGVCKRSTARAAEALECLGGNSYVGDSGMTLYQEAR